jgi:hypothetical protein
MTRLASIMSWPRIWVGDMLASHGLGGVSLVVRDGEAIVVANVESKLLRLAYHGINQP